MTTTRVTQSTARVVSDGTPKARITQAVIRVVSNSFNNSRVTQSTIRVVSSNTADVVNSQRPVCFVCT